MYIDVVEFKNAYFADNFQNVAEQFREHYRTAFERVTQNRNWCGHEPGFVYANFYHSVITYFLIENLFGGRQHLGMPANEAIDRMIDLSIKGFWKNQEDVQSKRQSKKEESGKIEVRSHIRSAKTPKARRKVAVTQQRNKRAVYASTRRT